MDEELPGAGPVRSFIYRHAPAKVQEWMQDNAAVERITKAIDADAVARDTSVPAIAQAPSAFETVWQPATPTVPQWLQEYEENLRAAPPQVARGLMVAEVREDRHDEIARKLREVAPPGPEAPAPAYQPTKSTQYVEEHRYHDKTAPHNVVEFKPPPRDERQQSWDWGR